MQLQYTIPLRYRYLRLLLVRLRHNKMIYNYYTYVYNNLRDIKTTMVEVVCKRKLSRPIGS